MELKELGFNEWFQQRLNEYGNTICQIARVTNVSRGGYLVRSKDDEVLSELAGEFAFSVESKVEYPVVGDWAFVRYYNDSTLAIIYDLLPRKTILRRKVADKAVDYQVIVANVDIAFIIQSCDLNFNPRRLERYMVMAKDGQVDPVILLSKSDLVSPRELESKISEIRNSGINCKVIAYSVETGSGLSEIQLLLQPGMTYCLLGSSGVGKTTLLNHLIGREEFEVTPVREKDSKGRHTTSGRQLVVLDNGAMLIDNPGMRELGNIDIESGIDEHFSDIIELSGSCRFSDCTHTHEAGCSVLEAVRSGSLSEAHYQNYLKLIKETEYNQMSYLEKRRKNRKFGQYVKSVMKRRKKK